VREIHVMHAAPEYAGAYAHLHSSVRWCMPHNGIVLDGALLDRAMRLAQPALQRAFESHAREVASLLTTARGRTTEIIVAQIKSGRVNMGALSRALGVSAATLRRRLGEEGTTFRAIVDEARRDLAERRLLDRRLSVGEIAFLVGFSNVAAFSKSFRRWTGTTPSEYRARVDASPPFDVGK
jgi:AraC-like DNA-binding protein